MDIWDMNKNTSSISKSILNKEEFILGEISGLSIGCASTLLMFKGLSLVEVNDNTQQDTNEGTNHIYYLNSNLDHTENLIVYHYAPIAENTNADMSFNEAFHAARNEVGPGGLFVWHGKLYNTYYYDEWNNMNNDQRIQYINSVHNTIELNSGIKESIEEVPMITKVLLAKDNNVIDLSTIYKPTSNSENIELKNNLLSLFKDENENSTIIDSIKNHDNFYDENGYSFDLLCEYNNRILESNENGDTIIEI